MAVMAELKKLDCDIAGIGGPIPSKRSAS